MISNPKCGWCNFDLGTFHGTPSYLTDVPIDLLEAFISFHTTGSGTVTFDEEGSCFHLVITRYDWGIYIIEKRDQVYLHDFSEIDIWSLEKELIEDIEKDLNGWAYFSTDCDDEKEIAAHKKMIENKIKILRNMYVIY